MGPLLATSASSTNAAIRDLLNFVWKIEGTNFSYAENIGWLTAELYIRRAVWYSSCLVLWQLMAYTHASHNAAVQSQGRDVKTEGAKIIVPLMFLGCTKKNKTKQKLKIILLVSA